jgi:hypothetical protein
VQLAEVPGEDSDVSAERASEELVPSKASAARADRAGKAAAEEVQTKAFVEILPGPWQDAPCPLLRDGHKGKLQAFWTIKSEQFGHTFFYRSTCCKTKVTIKPDPT